MAFNTKSIIKDVNAKPVPQYFNIANDVYEVLEGANGANKVMLYNADGNAISLQDLVTSIITAINATGTTQLRAGTNSVGKVEVTSNALPTGAATLAKQDDIIAAVNTTATTQLRAGTNSIGKVEVTSNALPTGAATLVKQDAIITAINTTGTTQLRAGTNSIGKIIVSADERDLRNLAANKPLASAVAPGTTYWSVDTDPHANAVEVSNGTSWGLI